MAGSGKKAIQPRSPKRVGEVEMSSLPVRLESRACLVVALLLSIAGGATAFSVTSPPPVAAASRITAIRAFTAGPGDDGALVLSDDIFAREQGNKPPFAGSGTANYPTHYLLVMVEVTDGDGRQVELTATEGRKVVWRKVSPLHIQAGGSSMDEKTYAVFFIEGDRCEVIRLRARLVGPGKPASMTKAIEFVCSE